MLTGADLETTAILVLAFAHNQCFNHDACLHRITSLIVVFTEGQVNSLN